MDGWELRELRRKAGLTASQVARATGTSETNVAAYERGDKVPGPVTRERLIDAIAAGSESPIFVNQLVTVPKAAPPFAMASRTDGPNESSCGSSGSIVRTLNGCPFRPPGDLLRKTFDNRGPALGRALAGSSDDLLTRGEAAPGVGQRHEPEQQLVHR